MSLLQQLYTPFPIFCLIAGYVGRVAYCHQQARWLDRHRPLPGHRPHRVEVFNRMVAGVAVGVFFLGYSVMKAQETQDITIANSHRTTRCVEQFQDALTLRSTISAQDLRLSKEIDKLRSENDRALAKFLERRFNPPPGVADLDVNDPRRLQWRDDITRIFGEWQGEVNKKIVEKQNEREDIDRKREQNPLPELKC